MNSRNPTTPKILQCLRRLPNSAQLAGTISRILGAYRADSDPWILGYSGGKDSTAVVKLVFQSLLRVRNRHKPVTVIYCDTGVEIPLASTLARKALTSLVAEAKSFDLPIRAMVLTPKLTERFFVKIIGRGYPPPTDKFRWCTDRLRIDPVSEFLQSQATERSVVVLGIRDSESATRHLTLAENKTRDRFWSKQRGITARRLFMPILDYSIRDVWSVNLLIDRPRSLRAKEVAALYEGASGECPTVRDVKGAPCGKARFGCWTCTVAKNRVTLRNLIAHGENRLEPLLKFRLWLEAERNKPANRWNKRRNGKPGLGPMTLEWRKNALNELLVAQCESGFDLIGPEEISAIHQEWICDDAQ